MGPSRTRLVSRDIAGRQQLVVLVDDEPLETVTRITLDYDYGQAIPRLGIELVGAEFDAELRLRLLGAEKIAGEARAIEAAKGS